MSSLCAVPVQALGKTATSVPANPPPTSSASARASTDSASDPQPDRTTLPSDGTTPDSDHPATPTSATHDASPPGPADEARERYDRGLSLYAEGEFSLAAIEFERAYDLVPDYRTLFNIGQVRLQLGQYAKAHAALTRYLADGGPEISDERRREVRADLSLLEARTAKLRVQVDVEGAEVSLDDALLGQAPLQDSTLVDAGDHRVTVRARGYHPKVVRLTLASQDSVTVPVRLEPLEVVTPRVVVERAPAPIAPAADVSSWRLAAWIASGSLAVGSAVTAVLGARAAHDLEQKRAQLGTSRDELDSGSRRAHTLLLTADVCGGLALLAGGAALYLTLSTDSDAADETTQLLPSAPQSTTNVNVGAGWLSLERTF